MRKIPENELNRLLESLSALQPREQSAEHAVERVRLELTRQRVGETEHPDPGKRRSFMARKMSRYAAAAALAAAGFIVWHGVQNPASPGGVVWAHVAKNMEQVRSYQYRERRLASASVDKTGYEIQSDQETRVYWLSECGSRKDVHQEGILSLSIFSRFPGREYTVVFYRQKQYGRQNVKWAGMGGDYDFVGDFVRTIKTQDYTELGPGEIDGIKVQGIELKGQKISGEAVDDAVTQIWVDEQTELPAFVELTGKTRLGASPVRIVQDQFVWNAPLEESFFQPNIPADFAQVDLGIEQTPKTENFVTTAHPAMKTPDFSSLRERGLVTEEETPRNAFKLSGMEEIWKEQDRIMATWPEYETARSALREELDSKIALADRTPDDRVQGGILLREKFWDAGGCLSTTSYRYGYMARIALEAAHERVPDDLAITDELVETIQSVMVNACYPEYSEERVRNPKFASALFDLRNNQVAQGMREIRQGRAPLWEDFVRGYDLSLLLAKKEQYEQARQVVQWLLDYAERGGWTAYRKPLEKHLDLLARRDSLNFNIYASRGSTFPEEFRYARRLFSFKGPAKRGAVPIHVLHPNPTWH